MSRHTKLDLNLLLEPLTDYTFDIELVNPPAPPPNTSVTPLFRRKFTTSRYNDHTEMCAEVMSCGTHQAPSTDSAIAGLVALASAPGPVASSAIDAALRQAGLDPVTQVAAPAAELLWVADVGGLQPKVLVLRTPEPLIRTRRTPVDYEPPGQPRLGRKIARLEDRPYLEVVATSGAPNEPTFQMVGAPGLGILVFLVTSGRGKTLDLSLRRHEDPFLDGSSITDDTELLKMVFTSAPWEVS